MYTYTYVVIRMLLKNSVRVHPDLVLICTNTYKYYIFHMIFHGDLLLSAWGLCRKSSRSMKSLTEGWTAGLLHWLSLKKSYHHQNQQMKHMLLSQETL